MILIPILSNNIENNSHSRIRPRCPPEVSARGDGPAVSFSLYMGRSYGHPADPCQTMPHGAKLADHAAPCANLLGGPIFGTVPTSAPDLEYL